MQKERLSLSNSSVVQAFFSLMKVLSAYHFLPVTLPSTYRTPCIPLFPLYYHLCVLSFSRPHVHLRPSCRGHRVPWCLALTEVQLPFCLSPLPMSRCAPCVPQKSVLSPSLPNPLAETLFPVCSYKECPALQNTGCPCASPFLQKPPCTLCSCVPPISMPYPAEHCVPLGLCALPLAEAPMSLPLAFTAAHCLPHHM